MRTLRALIAALLIAAVAAGCGDDATADGATTAGEDGTTEQTTTTAGEADDDGTGSGDDGGGAAATVTASDGSSWEFTEILECEIGEDGSPDYRQFIGRTADGSAQLNVAYFPESDLASLSGVDVEAEVDGNSWTYSDSYAGSEEAFDISLRPDGAEGTAPARVAGIGAPNADLTLDWSFTC